MVDRDEVLVIDDEIVVIDDINDVEVDNNATLIEIPAGWKILIVDDEPEVHRITVLTLNRFEFNGRPLEILHAYSGFEAKEYLKTESDIALVLLDVVMETDHAGLEVVKFIREQLNNHFVRIVLRTGQPGQAPEDHVLNNYDINDYREKTDLSSQKLKTLIRASLRSYQDIFHLDVHRRGLRRVLGCSRVIAEHQTSLLAYLEAIKSQLSVLLGLDGFNPVQGVFRLEGNSFFRIDDGKEYPYEDILFCPYSDKLLKTALEQRASVSMGSKIVLYCRSSHDNYVLLFRLDLGRAVDDVDCRLLDLFDENIVVGLENIRLNELIADNQREILYRVGELIETRSKESGLHVKRVALYTEQLCILLGLTKERTELIKRASPLHDVGKIGIPDSILHKPGKLEPEEWVIMQTHANLGYDMLCGSELELFKVGALIAGYHHEKWNGTGYPHQLVGEDIPLEGRIVALADVFDALGSDRCYKKAWPLDKVLTLIREERGQHFDPKLVDLLLSNLDRFLTIRSAYQDEYYPQTT